MTTDKIFSIYQQYKTLLVTNATEKDEPVYGVEQIAARLTLAHVAVERESSIESPPTAREVGSRYDETRGKRVAWDNAWYEAYRTPIEEGTQEFKRAYWTPLGAHIDSSGRQRHKDDPHQHVTDKDFKSMAARDGGQK